MAYISPCLLPYAFLPFKFGIRYINYLLENEKKEYTERRITTSLIGNKESKSILLY